MIRRAFLRRMASAAMAGMLGLELMSRVPKAVGTSFGGIPPGGYYGVGIVELMEGDQRFINRLHAARLNALQPDVQGRAYIYTASP